MTRRDRWFLVALVGLLTAVKLPLWNVYRPLETDEAVYRTLAERLPRYDLMGSWILEHLSLTVYNRPMFFHPPLFVEAVRVTGINMLVPWLSNAVTLLAVFWLGCRWFDRRRAWIATVTYAACPIAFLCACRLWIDGFQTMWMTLAVVAMAWCLERDRDGWFALPGLAVGLAALSKLPGLLALLPVVALWWRSDRPRRWQQAAWLLAPVVLLVTPWLLTVWSVYHSLALAESRIPDAELGHFPFIAMSRNRPLWFYIGGLLLVAPVHVFGYAQGVRKPQNAATVTLLAWLWGVIVPLTIFGLGNTFQLRYILPAMPALCLLGADSLGRLPRWVLALVGVMLLYGLANGVLAGLVNRALGDLVPVFGCPIPGLF